MRNRSFQVFFLCNFYSFGIFCIYSSPTHFPDIPWFYLAFFQLFFEQSSHLESSLNSLKTRRCHVFIVIDHKLPTTIAWPSRPIHLDSMSSASSRMNYCLNFCFFTLLSYLDNRFLSKFVKFLAKIFMLNSITLSTRARVVKIMSLSIAFISLCFKKLDLRVVGMFEKLNFTFANFLRTFICF